MGDLTAAELSAAPTIGVGGRTWPIPVLVARQLRVILPRWRDVAGIDYSSLTTEQFDLILDVLASAISRGTPEFTREDILDLPVTIYEIPEALNTIARQMGVLKRTEGGKSNAGEAKGESNSPISTGSSRGSRRSRGGRGAS